MFKKVKFVINYLLGSLVVNFQKLQLKTILRNLSDQDYTYKKPIPYQPQKDDQNWAKFGWKNFQDYQFWSERICAIACLKMILATTDKTKNKLPRAKCPRYSRPPGSKSLISLPRSRLAGPKPARQIIPAERGGFREEENKTMRDLTEEGLKLGGYMLYNQKGQFVDLGWFHKPLIKLASRYGFVGKSYRYISTKKICQEILKNHFVIASGNAKSLGTGKLSEKKGSSLDHLVLITGFKWEKKNLAGFYYHNPSGENRKLTKNAYLPINIFKKAFNYRAIVLWQNS